MWGEVEERGDGDTGEAAKSLGACGAEQDGKSYIGCLDFGPMAAVPLQG